MKLVSKGKLQSYLLYSMGEIILVVIGILIALQINNWNELKKTNREEITLIQQLINDLEKDSECLKRIIPALNDKSQVVKQIYLEAEQSSSFNASMNYGDLTWQVFAPLFFEQRHQRSLDKISDSQLSKSILDYFNQQKIVEFQIEQGNLYIRSTVRPFLGEHGVMNSQHVMSNDSYTELKEDKSKFVRYDELIMLYGSSEFESIIFELRMTYIATAHQVDLLLEANDELIEELTLFIDENGNAD